MLPRSTQIVIALVVLLAAAFGTRSLIARFGILDRSPAAAVNPSIDIQFVDIVPQDFRNFRPTRCNVMASIRNASRHHINDVNVRLGNWQFRFDVAVAADENLDRWNVGSIDLTDDGVSSCADQALHIFNTIAQASPWACAIDGLSEEECRSLVRISTRMDPKTIASIRYDEDEMGKRNMAAIEASIPQEVSYITDRIDNRSATATHGAGAATNDVVVLHYTTARHYAAGELDAGWHSAPFEKCSTLSILNKGGLAAFNASTRDIPSGYVWYAQPTEGAVRYGQVRIDDIAPSIFVAKCDAAIGFAELQMPLFHADGAPMATK